MDILKFKRDQYDANNNNRSHKNPLHNPNKSNLSQLRLHVYVYSP